MLCNEGTVQRRGDQEGADSIFSMQQLELGPTRAEAAGSRRVALVGSFSSLRSMKGSREEESQKRTEQESCRLANRCPQSQREPLKPAAPSVRQLYSRPCAPGHAQAEPTLGKFT